MSLDLKWEVKLFASKPYFIWASTTKNGLLKIMKNACNATFDMASNEKTQGNHFL
jgi:hypothetical protein